MSQVECQLIHLVLCSNTKLFYAMSFFIVMNNTLNILQHSDESQSRGTINTLVLEKQ